jgi:PPE-repeat protein
MNFAALPPEVNSARIYAGAGSGPILAAAAAWDAMAAELESAAGSYRSVIAGLADQSWQGPASASMAAAAAPYSAWMRTTPARAEQAATQAKAAAAAYETAFAMTVPPPVIAANRAQLATLVATNFLGQNTPAIAATEALYGEMWAQDAAAMYGYAGSAAAATRLTAFTAPKQNTNPGGLGSQTASVLQTAGTSAGTHAHTAASQLASAVPQTLHGLSQPLQSAAPTSGLGQMVGGSGAVSPGLTIELLAAGFEVATIAPFGAVSFGGAFAGLAITLGALAFPEGVAGLGGLAGLGLVGDVAPAGGLNLMGGVGPMAGVGGCAGGVGVPWSSMGKATSLGALSVPKAWAAAAPSAMRQVALVSAESTAGVASAGAAGGSEIPFAEMALACMAGRAMAGSAGRELQQRAGTTTRVRPAAPPKPPHEPTTPDGPVPRIGIVAQLRALAELRDSGILTEEKFNQRKQRLLDG